jgi:hypothetical protein
MGGDAMGHLCVVLTPKPRIFKLDQLRPSAGRKRRIRPSGESVRR